MGNVAFENDQAVLSGSCDCLSDSDDSFDSYSMQVDATLNRWLDSCSGLVFLGKIIWASPWSLWGLTLGCMGLLTGGGVQRSGRIVEFWGGMLPFLLRYFPFITGSPVAPFGHVVLGRSQRYLDACRSHQMIHVRQYECWGPLFVPMYLIWGVVQWLRGKNPYYDNPFEREAYDATRW